MSRGASREPTVQTPSFDMTKARNVIGRVLIYAALLFWTFICLFPIFWTVTTSFKVAVDITQATYHAVAPIPAGLERLALARALAGHDRHAIVDPHRVRQAIREQPDHLARRIVLFAVVIGSLAAYGLARFDYKFGPWRNKDISFFFLSQLILPPVALAMPLLVLYKELALLDTRVGHDPDLHADGAADRDLDHARPVQFDPDRAGAGGDWSTAATTWGAFGRIVLPIALPGLVAAFILSVILCWNEYFFAALLTATNAKTLPVMVASQTGSQGINWWSMAALSTAAIAPLAIIGIFLERYIVKGLTAGAVK